MPRRHKWISALTALLMLVAVIDLCVFDRHIPSTEPDCHDHGASATAETLVAPEWDPAPACTGGAQCPTPRSDCGDSPDHPCACVCHSPGVLMASLPDLSLNPALGRVLVAGQPTSDRTPEPPTRPPCSA